ncbi:reticulon-3 isoform X2 [Hyperolius riggenbachi]
MAEPGAHQSSHISSSSVGEKKGSCAESHPKLPSPESPGSPFEMIANSSSFEFKDSQDQALNYTLLQISAQRPFRNQSEDADEPLVKYAYSACSVNKDESCSSTLQFKAGVPVDDIPIDESKSNESHKEFGQEIISELMQSLPSIEGRPSQGQEAQDICEEIEEQSSAKNEDHSYDFKSDLHWPDGDEDMDSSGESDDTVIDAGWRVKNSELEHREHSENGWVELRNKQQNETGESLIKHEVLANNAERESAAREDQTQTVLVDPLDNLSRSVSKTPDSPHSEGFVDLAETYVTVPPTGPVYYSESESLEDQVQENLTLEALRALADGTQDWNSESQESSPEILCPQFGNLERFKMTDCPSESAQASTVGILTFKVHDLLFWRDVKKSGMVFGATMVVLLSLAAFSIISVLSYLVLSLLTVTISFRIYKCVMQAVQKSDEGHPFKALLDQDITLSSDSLQKKVNASLVHINRALKYIIRLFLVEDLVDSLKLALFMWLMTYVGAVFNGITLLILGVLVAFTAPVVYEKYKVQIDHYVSLVHSHVKAITEKIQAKLPGALKKKAE